MRSRLKNILHHRFVGTAFTVERQSLVAIKTIKRHRPGRCKKKTRVLYIFNR